MMVTMRAMHMAVRHLFFSGGTNFGHGDIEAQGLPSKRMVAVKNHLVALDFQHGEDMGLPILALAAQFSLEPLRLRFGG